YGTKGTIIIQSILFYIVGMDSLHGSSLGLLSLWRFTHYLLVPFVAAHLIAQDLGCDVKFGYRMMVTSCSVGEVLHAYEDGQDDEFEEV
ncbi:hypothetical protein EV363DRAFT_1074054, partial [Boletus edulis]